MSFVLPRPLMYPQRMSCYCERFLVTRGEGQLTDVEYVTLVVDCLDIESKRGADCVDILVHYLLDDCGLSCIVKATSQIYQHATVR